MSMSKCFRAFTICAVLLFTLVGGGWAVEKNGEIDNNFLLLMAARNAAKAKQYDQSVNRYYELLEKNPQFTVARTELAWVLLLSGKAEEARRHFEAVLDTKPRDPEALKGLLEVLKKSGRKDEVFKVLEQLVMVLPEDRDLRMQLAVELHNRGRYAEAEKHLNILLRKEEKK